MKVGADECTHMFALSIAAQEVEGLHDRYQGLGQEKKSATQHGYVYDAPADLGARDMRMEELVSCLREDAFVMIFAVQLS